MNPYNLYYVYLLMLQPAACNAPDMNRFFKSGRLDQHRQSDEAIRMAVLCTHARQSNTCQVWRCFVMPILTMGCVPRLCAVLHTCLKKSFCWSWSVFHWLSDYEPAALSVVLCTRQQQLRPAASRCPLAGQLLLHQQIAQHCSCTCSTTAIS